MQIFEKALNEIKPYENNPRNNDNAVSAVVASICEFGFKVPIVIDSDGVIVCGHTRYKAAQEIGLKTVPCVIADDLTPEQVKAFRLADNKVGELATWDFEKLELETAELETVELEKFGFEGQTEPINPDDFGEDFTLPEGEKPEIVTMSFTLHEKQKELISNAIESVKSNVQETFGNSNSNGNALYEVIREWAEQKKLSSK